MKPSNDSRIISKNNSERITVVLPVPTHALWPSKNIAFFCSTGQSGVKEFEGTYFPTFGVYVDDRTPIPDIDASITLSKNYFVKTSSITFLKPKLAEMQEWIFTLLRNYYENEGKLDLFQLSLNDVRDIKGAKKLRELVEMYKEMNLIYRCLSSYFSDIWQVFLSIGLSDTLHTGVWLSQLNGFATYMKKLSGDTYTISDKKTFTSVDVYTFLKRNDAQCDFTTLRKANPDRWYKVNHTSYMYDALYKNLQAVEISVRGAEKADEVKASKGGTRYKRKYTRKVTTKSRYV